MFQVGQGEHQPGEQLVPIITKESVKRKVKKLELLHATKSVIEQLLWCLSSEHSAEQQLCDRGVLGETTHEFAHVVGLESKSANRKLYKPGVLSERVCCYAVHSVH